MKRRWLRVGLGLVAASIGLLLWVTTRLIPVPAEPRATERPARLVVRTGTLPSGLRESSGVAVSRTQPGVLWTHNDSGHRPAIFAIDSTGKILAKYLVTNAEAGDWEDMAAGPCLTVADSAGGGAGCLYLADTGNNGRRRPPIALYVVPEPDVSTATRDGFGETAPARRIVLSYPDAAPDVEALGVTPRGDALLVSKGLSGNSRVYWIDRRAMTAASATAIPGRDLPINPTRVLGGAVTGAAVTPDGSRVAIRTYFSIHFYRLGSNGQLRETASCLLGAAEPQGEAVDFLDDESLILTSEALIGRSGPIHRVVC